MYYWLLYRGRNSPVIVKVYSPFSYPDKVVKHQRCSLMRLKTILHQPQMHEDRNIETLRRTRIEHLTFRLWVGITHHHTSLALVPTCFATPLISRFDAQASVRCWPCERIVNLKIPFLLRLRWGFCGNETYFYITLFEEQLSCSFMPLRFSRETPSSKRNFHSKERQRTAEWCFR